jgi:hypothetical protein
MGGVFIMIISVNIWYVAVMACCVYIRYVLLVFHPLIPSSTGETEPNSQTQYLKDLSHRIGRQELIKARGSAMGNILLRTVSEDKLRMMKWWIGKKK